MLAGYSGTPLVKKLGFKPGFRAHVVREPAEFGPQLIGLPGDVEFVGPRAGELDIAILFATRAAEVKRDFAPLAKRLVSNGMLWVAWPKKASGVATDVDFDVVQGTGLREGLVDVKVCAIDEVWTGLKFVRRLADRPKSAARKAK